jgi:hypothetical protein
VGETLKGPAFEPIFVKNFDEFTTIFGGTSPEKFVNTQIPKYEAAYIAKSYLQQSNQLFVSRILGLSGYDAGPSWSIKTIANVDKLYITGHSLGAAMATVAASRVQSKVTALVTFGSPRVGDAEFVKSLTVTHYRVQNNCDDVTKVPFRLMGFSHHGTHKYMNFYGEFRDLTPWQLIKDMARSRLKARAKGQKFIGVFDHMMTNYIAKLEKLGEK